MQQIPSQKTVSASFFKYLGRAPIDADMDSDFRSFLDLYPRSCHFIHVICFFTLFILLPNSSVFFLLISSK